MTSTEIEKIIKSQIEHRYFLDLYGFFCDNMKEAAQKLEFKNNYYKWLYACDEVGKTYPKVIDKTFPQAILCAHAKLGGEDKRVIKLQFGWDMDKVLKGKMCKAAEILIKAMEERTHESILM